MPAQLSDAERWMQGVKGRHETAVKIQQHHGGSYEQAYRLLKDAEAHPFDVHRQLAVQRLLKDVR
jgi:hypothetical protein